MNVELREVFGISTSIPVHTYVDRAKLDRKFQYFIKSDRHIVIHGASKQGKTILRKKNFQEQDCIIVQCRSNSSLEQIYLEILRQIGSQIPTELTKSLTLTAEGKTKASGGIKLPLIASGSAEVEIAGNLERETERVFEFLGQNPESLGYIIDEIRNSKKRIIIEDFHYLLDEEKKRFAFDLKAFWDSSIFLIIIGIWADQNLLTYYNGDLSGRINEIDVQWTDQELNTVLTKGEKALNISFDQEIKKEILADANQNVGLLQRIAELFCLECNILENSNQKVTLRDLDALNRARQTICNEESVRYRQFIEAVRSGFRGSESELKVYQRIVKVCLEASDMELCNGLNQEVILNRINQSEPNARLSDLSAALNRLNKLQGERSISPLILSYNPDSRKVQLVDRELLFFRKYTHHKFNL